MTNKHQITDQIADHLECLGYVIEPQESDDDMDVLFGQSESRANLIIFSRPSLVTIRAYFSTRVKAGKPLAELMSLINGWNHQAFASRWFLEAGKDKSDIVVEFCVFKYDKQLFGRLMGTFEKEITANMKELVESNL
ncbi:YbjN domain-containing protein [Patescibacteria group bacterium]|nr:YbjN domain-containing protein [Patescibacteria group bacterium]MBU1906635.1 YbjN domain-containing protein [Patescibacteria group bacterium]